MTATHDLSLTRGILPELLAMESQLRELYHPALEILHQISRKKTIHIYSMGACSWEFFRLPWLREIVFDEEKHPGFFLFVSQ